ncbi:GntR family transcriptional regulator [Pseudonocardia asaccharolytica]|uniref:Putative HTH-type transcriptional regulator YmfC n=1 Tax=Pseudonocardia asaccharolytica DSM 44247 = NBRC 16224 TaxID=1123024 RepID=A0A511D5P7_9PSEU|nr:GntR family transcriptional regulator [Pseudonocardia asaccharolytica]GEL20120.1 putative HTH-type transcriptional regulator YmfC [Pseudonocardia asaccharolytica DSM 44247 = NBRC 16224]
MVSTSRRTLADDIVRALKAEIRGGSYAPGSRLPTEAELCRRFGVSRATVRGAVKELDVLGLVRTQHGVGTFVTPRPAVRDGLERMGSITESIRASGKIPGHEYARRTLRPLLPDEAERMGVPPDTEVLELRRRITADGDVVAYSYDLIPRSLLPERFDPEELTGSVFAYFENRLGIHPTLGMAKVHAVESVHIAWGPDAGKHRLFILLDQLHYDRTHRMLAYSRTYFVEGAYEFHLVRTSD